MTDLDKIAEIVDEAARTATEIAPFFDDTPLGPGQAHEIRKLSKQRRYPRGGARVGVKMSLSARAKMTQVGVCDVTRDRLTDAMRFEAGGAMSVARLAHPRAEPVIASLMKAPPSATTGSPSSTGGSRAKPSASR